jgi:hypothetical protein
MSTVSKAPAPKPEVIVVRPEDPELLMLIHRTIERVLLHGPMFEALIIDKESRNPQFDFLFQNDVSYFRSLAIWVSLKFLVFSQQNMFTIDGSYTLF